MSEENQPPEGGNQEQSFTQEDVDRIVAERLKREREATKAKYADYDQIKVRAEGAKSLEDRVAEIERQAKDSESRALRAEVANAKGLTPAQAKRLIGSTKEELEADADELLQDIGTHRHQNNVSPREGNNPQSGGTDSDRAFVRDLFGRANAD